ncbi:MAG: rhodanese-like domain-containing protein [Verrucomicrobia bacterium]|nr:rhodanese-like domain-containing protein [Verrucomicrobiota bacterium]
MTWMTILGVAGVLAACVFLKQLNSVTEEAAREYLRQGAKVIDVRTAQEYSERHLPKTINIPLDELKQRIVSEAPDKETVLLLHCRSGGRSGVGTQTLKSMGYKNVFNLGSFEQAEKILGGSGK